MVATGDEGTPDALPELAGSLVEALARFMRADQGNFTLEFQLQDGKFSRWRKHEGPAGVSALAKFSEEPT